MMKYSIVFKADEEADSSISHGDSQIASEYLFQHAIGAALEVSRGHHMISRPGQGALHLWLPARWQRQARKNI
jgi:hypothetical protein